MRKLNILLFILVIVTLALAVNLNLNLKVRGVLQDKFQKHEVIETSNQVILASSDMIYIDDLSETVTKNINHAWLKVDWLKYMDMTAQYDETLAQLNIVGYDQFVTIASDGAVTLNGSDISGTITLKRFSEEQYIALDELLDLTDGQLPWRAETNEATHEITITAIGTQFGNSTLKDTDGIYVNQDASFSADRSLQSLMRLANLFRGEPYSEIVYEGQRVYATMLEDGVVMVLTQSGNLGYISDSNLTLDAEPEADVSEAQAEIRIAWEYVGSRNPNTQNITNLGTHIDVLSPTWYALTDENGTLSNKYGATYAAWTKAQGYALWPLVTNGFDPEMTHLFLTSAEARAHFINTLVTDAVANSYDGINVDFENVYLEDKDNLTHFINELAWYLKPLGITLSMDVTVIAESDNWSKCFDRETLGKIVDYLVIMTYDEYWASSPISGPVASFDWVERSLNEILEIVPAEKLIMGIPLYTRVWTETPSTTVATNLDVDSSAIGIASQNALIESLELEPMWSEEDHLYYVSYIDEGVVKKMWIENVETIADKINLSRDLGLSGYAFWRRGFEPETFFDELEARLENE